MVVVVSSLPLICSHGGAERLLSCSNLYGRRAIPSSSPLKFAGWGLRRFKLGSLVGSRTIGHAFHVLANPKVSPGKGDSSKEVSMVDPLEAKRLAARQMEEIKAREKLKRRRYIETINGAWAMVGLTIGLVIEGRTGKGILAQLASYLSAFLHLFIP